MKKLFNCILCFLTLALLSSSYAGPPAMQMILTGSEPDDASGCMSGTYLSAWDGDYSGDSEEWCFASGGSTKSGTLTNGTIHTDYGETGYGFLANSDDDYFTAEISSDDGFNDAVGTICMRVKVVNDDTDGDIVVFEAKGDANNYHYMMIRSNREVRLYTVADGGLKLYADSSSSIQEDTWVTIGVSWRSDTGNDSAATHDGSTWTEEDRDGDPTYVGTDSSQILIGNFDRTSDANETVYIDKVAIMGTYKASCPW